MIAVAGHEVMSPLGHPNAMTGKDPNLAPHGAGEQGPPKGPGRVGKVRWGWGDDKKMRPRRGETTTP